MPPNVRSWPLASFRGDSPWPGRRAYPCGRQRHCFGGGRCDAHKRGFGDGRRGYSSLFRAKKAFGGIDILVNNAGAYEARDWFETTPATWRLFFETDVLSAVRLVLAVAPDWPSTALPLAEIAPFISETRMPQLKQ